MDRWAAEELKASPNGTAELKANRAMKKNTLKEKKEY